MDERSLARFMRKIEVLPNGCWRWTPPLKGNGYGVFFYSGKKHPAHRIAYEHFVGPMPAAMEPDHLCHTSDSDCPGGWTCPHRACVNPAHLEPVTRRVNNLRGRSRSAENARKDACKYGHPFDSENTYYPSTGGRQCRICNARRAKEAEAKRLKGPRAKPTACPQGHPYEGENLAYRQNGAMRCRQCARERARARYDARKAAGLLGQQITVNPSITHCPQGHEYTAENSFYEANGRRRCRECNRQRSRQAHQRRREAAA